MILVDTFRIFGNGSISVSFFASFSSQVLHGIFTFSLPSNFRATSSHIAVLGLKIKTFKGAHYMLTRLPPAPRTCPSSIFHVVYIVAYFNQRLGAAHSKCWLKYAFSTFFAKKLKKCITLKILKYYLAILYLRLDRFV